MAETVRRNRLVTYLLAVLGGAAGVAIGWLVTGFVADALLGLGGMSDREGGRAMLAFFAFGPFGALAGLLLGAWLVLRFYGGYRRFAEALGGAAVVAAALAAVAAAVFGVLYLSDDVLVRNGPPPQAYFELRLPSAAVLPAGLEGVRVDLNTDKNEMPGTLTGTTTEQDRPIIAGSVDLYFRTASRILVLRLPGEPDRLFMLNLARNPSASPQFGPWQRVDYVDDHPPASPRKGGDGDDYQIRYRVERAD